MTTEELAARLAIATSTVRSWTALKQYGAYFSEAARSSGGRRYFDDQDARVMALIVTLKAEQKSPDDIHATLQRYQADDWRGLPDLPAAPPGVEPVSMIPREAAEGQIVAQRQALLREIATLQDRAEALEAALRDAQADKARITAELADTRQRLGELEGRLAERRDTVFWLRVGAVVVFGVLVVAGGVILLLLAVAGR